MKRIELFEKAAAACKEFLRTHPTNQAIQSIIKQIEYLISLETGKNRDRKRLKDVSIGILTVREIEPLDMDLAEKLHEVSAEARQM
jgi:hypothetical protein